VCYLEFSRDRDMERGRERGRRVGGRRAGRGTEKEILSNCPPKLWRIKFKFCRVGQQQSGGPEKSCILGPKALRQFLTIL
jgi:hypothetical protein